MEEVINYAGYGEYKAALDRELSQTAEGFVRIGYLLRMAMETDILKESGYANVLEFAEKEYSLDKSQVSRFININIKFSENGNSDQLEERYRGFGYAKLALMLQLPDTVNELITPKYSKSEILAIKSEIDEEKKISDLEVLAENGREPEKERNNLQKVVRQLGRENPELYVKLHEAARMEKGPAEYREILAPMGEGIYSVRIPGAGRMMLGVKDVDREIVLLHVRSNETEAGSWEELLAAIRMIVSLETDARMSWEKEYMEPFPMEEKEEVAPVQQKKQSREKKSEAKKTSKVTKAKTKLPKAKEPERKNAAEVKEPGSGQKKKEELQIQKGSEEHSDEGTDLKTELEKTEEIEGQTSVEDHPDWLPKDYIRCYDGSEVLVTKTEPDPDVSPAEGAKPCPFCGGNEIMYIRYQHEAGLRRKICCIRCMAGIDPGWTKEKEVLLKRWNRRVDDTGSQVNS